MRPVTKDEEYNALTRQLLEEKKGARTDYDSYRRSASSASSPMYVSCFHIAEYHLTQFHREQDRADVKVRQAKEKYDIASRRFADHLEVRNRMKCKVLVHGVLTAFQQYHAFYTAAADILKDTSASIKPLLDVYHMTSNTIISLIMRIYQLNEQQLLDTINLDRQHSNQGNNGTGQGGKYSIILGFLTCLILDTL